HRRKKGIPSQLAAKALAILDPSRSLADLWSFSGRIQRGALAQPPYGQDCGAEYSVPRCFAAAKPLKRPRPRILFRWNDRRIDYGFGSNRFNQSHLAYFDDALQENRQV